MSSTKPAGPWEPSVTTGRLAGQESRMSIADILRQTEPEESDKPEPVELVSIPDSIDNGVGLGNPLPFPDVASALAYARKLPPDERDVCFIRTSEGALTLAQAE